MIGFDFYDETFFGSILLLDECPEIGEVSSYSSVHGRIVGYCFDFRSPFQDSFSCV